jgi:glycyl-tRNA synthetase beta chain
MSLARALFAVIEESQTHAGRGWQDRVRDSLHDTQLIEGVARDLLVSADALAPEGHDRAVVDELLEFLADRLKVALREQGVRHDLIDAVFSLGREDDLVRLVARVRALGDFLKGEDGANLLAGYRRAVNILRIEEKKEGRVYSGEPDPSLLSETEEKLLFAAMATAREMIAAELARERFAEAMIVMARLRIPVDAFFDRVTVNAADAALRENRLLLLARLRDCLHAVADFSKIEG